MVKPIQCPFFISMGSNVGNTLARSLSTYTSSNRTSCDVQQVWKWRFTINR